jgi:pimeloyl-ACP methyl ester carboxylesterase
MIALTALVTTLPWSASTARATTSSKPIAVAADAGTPPFANPPVWLGHCTALTVPVTLPNRAAAHMAGHLCVPARARPHVVLLLLHGATYNSSYWSWPQDPADRSFVWQALAAGYAVMVPDRLGYGQSSRPSSSEVTFTAQARTLHQVVLDLHNGRLGRYQSIIGIGHSYGSAELANLAATYPHDVAAVIMTGSGHQLSTQTTQQAATLLAPATSVLPQRFGNLDPGYVTAVNAQARLALLYDPHFVSPAVLDYDTATEDTLPIGEAATRPPDIAVDTTQFTVPSMLIDGQHDSHYCDGAQTIPESGLDDCSSGAALYASERANYPPCFAAAVVPDSGHDLTTEQGASLAARLMLHWALATLPPMDTVAKCSVVGFRWSAGKGTAERSPASHAPMAGHRYS